MKGTGGKIQETFAGKAGAALPRFLAALAVGAALALPLRAADPGIEFGIEDDLTVFGTQGNSQDPDLEVRGFSVFGSTQMSYPGALIGPGNVVINGSLYVSSNSYFVGNSTFVSAGSIFISDGNPGQILRKRSEGSLYWADLSSLGDNLGNHLATATLNMAEHQIINVSSLTVVGKDDSGFSLWLSSGINMAGGRIEAGLYSGSGELLTNLNASQLTSGTVPLARLSGITRDQIDADAKIQDTQLDTIHTSGKVLDTALSPNVDLLDASQTLAGVKTFASSVTVRSADGIAGTGLHMGNNISVSSEAAAALGGGVRVSTNMYVVGFTSAAKFYGDGSGLTNLPKFGDDLGNHVATKILDMSGFGILNASTLTLTGMDPNGYSMLVSSGIYMPAGRVEAAVFSGNGSRLTDLNAAQLTAGTVPLARLEGITKVQLAANADIADTQLATILSAGKVQDTALTKNVDLLDANQTASGVKTFVSSLTVTSADGIWAQLLNMGTNSSLSKETSADLGAGLRVSTNLYVVGFTSAAKFFGDGSGLTNLPKFGDDLGNHVATRRLDMAGFQVMNVSSLTVTGADVASGYSLTLSSGINMPQGRVEAAVFSGNGSPLTDLNASQLASGTVPLARLEGITKTQLDANAGILDTQLATIHTAGKVLDTALSANVDLLNADQTASGVKTFTSSLTVTDASGISASGVRMGPNVLVSSESVAALGGGVRVSTNMYVVGFTSAAKFFGDGSGLTNLPKIGDDLGNHTATRMLDMAGFSIHNVSTLTLTGVDASGYSMLVSSGIYMPAGRVDAAVFSGNGSQLTDLNAGQLASGTVPLARLEGITKDQIASNAGIMDTQLSTISAPGKVFDSALSSNVDLLDAKQTVSGIKTYTSSVTVTGVLGTPRVQLADNVAVSSEAAADLGGGVRISTNLYVVGFTSAAKYFGDGSGLTNLAVSGDDLGNHTATKDLNMANFHVVNMSTLTITAVDAASGYSLMLSSGINMPQGRVEAALYSGDGSLLTALNASQLASGTVPLARLAGITRTQIAADAGIVDTQLSTISAPGKVFDSALSSNVDLLDAKQTVTGIKTYTSSVTVTGLLGTPRVQLANNVAVSSEAAADLGGGVRVSTNLYVVGFTSAAKFFGDGSGLTNLTVVGDDLGNHTATKDLNMANFHVVNMSTLTIKAVDQNGYSLTLSSGINMPQGRVEAALYSGDGSLLTALNASQLASGTVPLARLEGITKTQIAADAGIVDTQLSTISAPGKVFDSALSSNVELLDAKQTVSGIKTYTSSVTVTGVLGTPRVQLADHVYVSSEAAPDLGAGVRISTNLYVVGFTSAAKFFGDGSGLTNLTVSGDNLGDHTATKDLNMANFHVVNMSTLTITAVDAASGYSVALSSGLYMPNGRVEAALYSGDGSLLTALNASQLASGTVPLARLEGITKTQIAADAGIVDTQLSTISAPGKVFDSALSSNVELLDAKQTITGIKTYTSSVTVTGLLGTPRVQLANNVAVSSEALASLGGGVRVSTNLYVVGFTSSTKFYGDGSELTNLPVIGDNLGSHTATRALNLAGFPVFAVASMTVTGAGADGYSLSLSSGIYMPNGRVEAGLYSGDGSLLTSLNASQLASGTVPLARLEGITKTQIAANAGIEDMQLSTISTPGKIFDSALSSNVNLLNSSQTITGIKTYTSSVTVTGLLGTPRLQLANNVAVSSEALASLGGGVRVSTNMYIVGFASAAAFYGDGSGLTNLKVAGDNLGNHTATKDLNMANFHVVNMSTLTITAVDAASGYSVALSSGLYMPNGRVEAALYSGDGSLLTSLNASQLASGTVPLARLEGITKDQIAANAGIEDMQLSTISTPGKIFDSALSSNVELLDAKQTITGIKTYTSSVTVTGLLGTPRVQLANNVAVSSEALASLGGGVRVSTNLYVVGFTSSTKFYGDGSELTNLPVIGDHLGNHTATRALNLAGFPIFAVASMTVTGAGADGYSLSLSSGIYMPNGRIEAALYAGDGSLLTNLNASQLASGTVPLDRLEGITRAQIAADAGIEDMQLSTISTPGKVFDSALSSNVDLLDSSQTITGIKTFTSTVTVASLIGAPRLDMDGAGVSISSRAVGDYGGGVNVSTGMYVEGPLWAQKFHGDGSGLTNLTVKGDDLGNHTATKDLDMADFHVVNMSTLTITASDADTGYTMALSSGIYMPNGRVEAALYSGSGELLTSLNASNLASGTVPLARLEGITRDQIAANAGIEDMQLSTISTPGKIFDSALSSNVELLDAKQTITGIKTYTSSVTVTGLLGTPRVQLANNVAVSSEALASLGGGVRVSTNLYVVGFTSSTKFYGDGSELTNLPVIGDHLGNHTATRALNLAGFPIFAVASMTVTGAGADGYSLSLSSGIYMPAGRVEAGLFSGNGSLLTDLNASNLASGTVPLARLEGITRVQIAADAGIEDMQLSTISTPGKVFDSALSSNVDLLNSSQTITAYKTFASSVTARSVLGTPRVEFADNVMISSESSQLRGGGVYVSTNMYIVGFASAARFFGDGSGLTNLQVEGDDLGSHIATRRLDMNNFQITDISSMTVSSQDASGFSLALSSGLYMPAGRVEASIYSGSGELLTSLNASNLASGTVPLARLVGITREQIAPDAGIEDMQLSTISTPGKVFDSALSSNVELLDAKQVITANKTFTSSVTVAGLLGAPKVEFSTGVAISSEALASLGGGVRVSTNMYVVGFASAAMFFGDGSGLINLKVKGDDLGSHIATKDLDLNNFHLVNVSTLTVSSYSASGYSVSLSSGLYMPAGRVEAAVFSGNGSQLTDLNASQLTSGTVPLARLEGITKDQLASDAGILDTQLSTISAPGKVLDSALSSNVDFLNANQVITGIKTETSSFTVTAAAGIGSPKLRLADNVLISSETLASLGAGVRVSTNMYIIGFASATKFYGDGSGLTNMTQFADNLGNHVATTTLNMAYFPVINIASITVSGKDADSGYSVSLSSGIYMPAGRVEAGLFSGNGTLLNDLNASNLSTGTVPLDRLVGITKVQIAADAGIEDMQLSTISTPGKIFDSALSSNVDLLDSSQTVTAYKTFTSSVTVRSVLGAPRLEFADNVFVSSEANQSRGGGVYVSTNMYIVGFASAAKFFGDGSGLVNLKVDGDNLGNHTATQRLNMADFSIVNVSTLTVSSYSASGYSVSLSSGLYMPGGRVEAAVLSGNGSPLTDLNASQLTTGTVPLARLEGITRDQISGSAAIEDTQLSTISTPGKVFDSALSSNVDLLDASQLVTGVKTYFSSITVHNADGLEASRLKLNDNVVISSEATASLGGGLRISSNTYIVGFTSATKYFGDGSELTNLPGDNLGSHIATKNLSMDVYDIGGTGDLAMSTLTATGYGVVTPRVKLADNVIISTEPASALGGGVRVSTNMYIVGFASAAMFFGDGSGLVNLKVDGDNLGNHIATKRLEMDDHAIVNISSLTVNGTGLPALTPLVSVAGSTFTVLANGNVGIGVASPSDKFEVSSSGGSSMQFDTSVSGIVTIKMGGVAVAEMLP